ncbi:hypothetical protein J6590_099812 [Homalodisca vitripennis]|nr:hypothetical protein J6590_099812 [Homalodisca vitripennis]
MEPLSPPGKNRTGMEGNGGAARTYRLIFWYMTKQTVNNVWRVYISPMCDAIPDTRHMHSSLDSHISVIV